MRILLTGFEPFDQSPINPSEQIVQTLSGMKGDGALFPPNVQIVPLVLPVDLVKGPEKLQESLVHAQPDAVISLGQASQRTAISIERVAVNLLDFRIPDNAGIQVSDKPIEIDGPAAYFTTLPVRRIYEAITAAGIPAELSLTAGAYLCNQVTYHLLHYLAVRQIDIPAGFIHLPALPEQAAKAPRPIPSMSLEVMVQAVGIAVNVVAGLTDDGR